MDPQPASKPRTSPARIPAGRKTSDDHLYLRGETYWCRFVVKGEEKRVSLRTADVKIARRQRDALLVQAEDVRAGRQPEVVHVWQDAVEAFLTKVLDAGVRYPASTSARYQVSLRRLGPVLDGIALADMTTGTVSDFVTARREDEVSVSTIKNDLVAWSMVLSFAASERMTDSNPVRVYDRRWLGQDADALDPPSDPEVQVTLAEIASWSADMVRLMRWLRETGMRLKEALHVQREDVDPDGQHVTLSRGVKGNRRSGLKTRTIHLGRASALLAEMPEKGRLFASLSTDSATVSTRYGQWKRQRQGRENVAAQLEGRPPVELFRFRLHDLRHAFAIASLIDSPTRIYELQRHMGHSTIKTTELYARFMERQGRRRIRERDPLLFGSLPTEDPTGD